MTLAAPETYDPFSPAVMNNPLPFYARLRNKAPALFLPQYDTWVFSRFQGVIDVLTVCGNTFIAKRIAKHPNEEWAKSREWRDYALSHVSGR